VNILKELRRRKLDLCDRLTLMTSDYYVVRVYMWHVVCGVQAGLRPVCEFMTFNFSMQAIDQVRYIC
jgi:hypothetical protein